MRNIECGVDSVYTFNGHGLFAYVAFEWNNAVSNFSCLENVDVEVYTRLKGVAGEVVDVHVRLKGGASAAVVVKLYSR